MRTPVSVLLLEDDSRMAAFLDRGLTQAGFQVLDRVNGRAPDLIVAAGLQRLEQVRDLSAAPVLVLTPIDRVDARIEALNAGADDVLAKPFDLQELLARLRALSRRRELVRTEACRGTLQYADLELDQDQHEVRRNGRTLNLRRRAYELLAYCMRNPGRVLSRSELLQHVWGWDDDQDSNVIEVTVSQLRRGMGEPRLIHTVRPVGYILKSPHPTPLPEVEGA